jgi:hypothetical protein
MPALELTDAEVIRVAMRLLGQRTSKRKAESSRRNGLLGGKNRAKSKKQAKIKKHFPLAHPNG